MRLPFINAIRGRPNSVTRNRIVTALLTLSSFVALVLFHFSSTPPGIDGAKYIGFLNAGRISDLQALVISADRHAQLLPYWHFALWGVLVLTALLSAFAFRQTFSTRNNDA